MLKTAAIRFGIFSIKFMHIEGLRTTASQLYLIIRPNYMVENQIFCNCFLSIVDWRIQVF